MMFGRRCGASVRLAVNPQGRHAVSWPAWESDDATKVREICRAIAAPLACCVAERAIADSWRRSQ